LALATQGPAVFARLLAADEGLKSDFCARERALLGVTHGEIGAYLLELWGLPPRVVEAVRFHHEPGRSAYNGLCAVTCVHAADALVSELVPVARPQAVDLRFARLDVAYLERVGVADRCESWRQIATDFLQGIQQREEVLV
ncbi:MAG: HDOD domain-containing protein, partial [Planctomycetes bacterium]|nr:HDOD domain-containing protein [Planctomycetota bacterium]